MNKNTDTTHLNYANLSEPQVKQIKDFEESFNTKSDEEVIVLAFKKSDSMNSYKNSVL
ncbi:MAG: hypothetical protein H7X94_11660 [Vallitaleaceae bacterium]|nr:hypothetical protein [Vallitaleaceae bacterium]